jgi:uncharacterized membrane protein YtjA (UPF0391 family)
VKATTKTAEHGLRSTGSYNQAEQLQLRREETMLRYAVIFFIIAIIAAVFGFGGIAAGAAGIAQILFYVFLAVFIISLIFGVAGGRRSI